MRDMIDMAREAGLEISHTPPFFIRAWEEELKAFADLVRADERARLQPKKIKAVKEEDYCRGDERYYAND